MTLYDIIWHYMTLLTWWNLVNLRGAECLSTPCCQGHEPRPRNVAAMSAVATAPMALMALAAVNVARPRRRRNRWWKRWFRGGSGRYWTWKLDLKSSCCWKNWRFIFFWNWNGGNVVKPCKTNNGWLMPTIYGGMVYWVYRFTTVRDVRAQLTKPGWSVDATWRGCGFTAGRSAQRRFSKNLKIVCQAAGSKQVACHGNGWW